MVMVMKRWYIYALRDPITWDVRYVGKANDPAKRLIKHLSDCTRHTFYAARWIKSLVGLGMTPMLEILDAGSGNGHGAAEQAWIEEFRQRGARLTNTARGGIGGSGPVSAEARAKISAAHTGTRRSPETCARIAASKRDVKQRPEAIAKRAASLTGLRRGPETGRKIAATKIGKPRDEATCAKIAATLTGRTISDAVRASMSAAQKERRAKEAAARQTKEADQVKEAA